MKPPAPTVSESDPALELHAAEDEVADLFGDIAAFWGFTRTQGRVFGMLFLARDVPSQAEIRERLGISAGSASMTLASLLDWGVLRRDGRGYTVQTDLWALVTGVMRRREREVARSAIERLGRVLQRLSAVHGDERVVFARRRVAYLHDLFRLGSSFLDAFLIKNPVRGLIHTIARHAKKLPHTLAPGPDARIAP